MDLPARVVRRRVRQLTEDEKAYIERRLDEKEHVA